jgi:hypothetical protein
MKSQYDELYGETRTRMGYGDRLVLSGVPVKQGAVDHTIWTTTLIPTGSILYSRQDRRWWRVSRSLMQDGGGYLIVCSPSDETPDFSD